MILSVIDTLPIWVWAAFMLFIVAMLALDLGVFHKDSHEIKTKEALVWCAVWFSLAMAFNAIIYFWQGKQPAMEFFTGYLIEICLSVDNVFVFILIFTFFKVPKVHQHRVLFWGIIGAVVMRALFIAGGIALISHFTAVLPLFGAFLIFTGIKMALPKSEEADPEKNFAVRLVRKIFPVTPNFVEGKFFTKIDGRRFATPLFIVLVAIETTDVIFAVDSIPAILGITKDGFIVFTSNIFAILGLRSLYFALSGSMQLFRFLGHGLALILIFIGAKMVMAWEKFGGHHVPIAISLGIIGSIIALSVIASLVFKEKKPTHPATLPGSAD